MNMPSTISTRRENERNFQWHAQSVKGEGLQWLCVRGHQGHSIGCSLFSEEYPFIAPGEDRGFEENMVMNIELPYYSSKNQTYNIEDTFLVTKTGIELFTKASPSLYI